MPDRLAPLRRALPAFLPRRVLLALRRDLSVANLTGRLASVYGERVASATERWLVVSQLPRGSTRKVDKKALAKRF